MKPLVIFWVICAILFPILLLVTRRFNVSLGCFYAIVGVEIVADLSGGGFLLSAMPAEDVGVGIWVFAVVVAVEYCLRRDYLMAVASSVILLQLGAALRLAAFMGAFD